MTTLAAKLLHPSLPKVRLGSVVDIAESEKLCTIYPKLSGVIETAKSKSAVSLAPYESLENTAGSTALILVKGNNKTKPKQG
jgi:hypothetical protein